MAWWLAGAAALEGAKVVSGVLNAEKVAAQQRREAEEQRRRMVAQHAQELGQAGAVAGASGLVAGASSLAQHIAAMSDEFRRQEEWLVSAGRAQAGATQQAGWWGGLTDLGAGMFKLGAATNWGRKV